MILKKYAKYILFWGALFFLIAGQASAVNGDTVFNVDKDFEAAGKDQVTATLVKTGNNLNFYIDGPWWDSQTKVKQDQILIVLENLSVEFSNKIYPTLTSVFGSEWKPGVDGEDRITVLFHSMNSNEGGYFRTNDEYIKLQLPNSNEREMLYLATDYIDSLQLKVILAHEFMHLITFNQKNKIFGLEEDTWLNEARADYTSTILGYDDPYQNSNLQKRVQGFIENPSDSITEWSGTKYDYSSVSMFTHYLMDHYGINILSDSLKSKLTGIESINYALSKVGYKEKFDEIFTNWTVASVTNNCSAGEKYCYLSTSLKNFKLAPSINFLPVTGNVSLSVANVTKNWTGNWLKFIGGSGDLQLDFSGIKGINFKVPYIIEDSAGSFAIKFLALDNDQKGQIEIKKFGTDFKSLIIIPTLQSQIYHAEDLEPTYPYSYKVTITGSTPVGEQDLIQQLLARIAALKEEIARLRGETSGEGYSCSALSRNLSFGAKGNDVKCLQEFLKSQGSDIYPEGLVTGNFGSLTRQAVIKFQEKYVLEILSPIGLSKGTGFVGSLTRAKINQLLSGT